MADIVQGRRAVAAFLRLGRPYFLVAGFVMHGVGVCAAIYAGATLDWNAVGLGQLAITATQWMVHYANDYFDLPADRQNLTPTFWSGGSQVLPRRQLRPQVAYVAALALAGISCAAILAMSVTVRARPVAPFLAMLALFLSWGYSAPPFRWHSRGFGELVTAFVVAVLTPVLGFYLQTGYVPTWLLTIIWPLFSLQFCFQLSVNFPDLASDTRSGKRTLVVRDTRFAIWAYLLALTGAYAGGLSMLASGLPILVVVAVFVPLPAALWLWLEVRRGGLLRGARWTAINTLNVALVMVTALAEAGALLSVGL